MKAGSYIVLILSFFVVTSNAAENDINVTKIPQQALYNYTNSDFSINIGAVILIDYTFFNQDTPSLDQVGLQEDQSDLRAVRGGAYGKFNLFGEWGYLFVCDFGDFIENTNNDFCSIMDLILTYRFADGGGKITIGKMKEPWSYEMVGESVNLPHHERFLNPLFETRNVGVRYNNTYAKERGTYAVGIYNDWMEGKKSFNDSGHQVVTRVTGLPYISNNNENYLHVGGSLRYNAGKSDTLRYRGKPESNVADWYVDTGDIKADHAWEFGLEALWSHNGVSLLSEYIQSNIASKTLNDPTLDGFYVTGGWVLSGESRPYNRNAGYAQRIIPKGNLGAVELIARYGDVDLDDKEVHGGHMRKWMGGVNWWIDRYWKASVSYGIAHLNRFDLEGKTEIMLLRLQWVKF